MKLLKFGDWLEMDAEGGSVKGNTQVSVSGPWEKGGGFPAWGGPRLFHKEVVSCYSFNSH